MKWKHPDTIALHCPKQYLKGFGANKPPRGTSKPVKAKRSTVEEDRLRQLLLLIIREFVQPVNPARAAQLLKQVYPAGDPGDGLEGYYDGETAAAAEKS